MLSDLERVLSNTQKDSNGCLLWGGAVLSQGYGVITIRGKSFRVHRLVYELSVGKIQKGLVINHKCHTKDKTCNAGDECLHRRCVNIDHLEVTTNLKNIQEGRSATKTHCVKGHELSGDNLMIGKSNRYHPRGQRFCKICYLERSAAHRQRNLEKIRERDRATRRKKLGWSESDLHIPKTNRWSMEFR